MDDDKHKQFTRMKRKMYIAALVPAGVIGTILWFVFDMFYFFIGASNSPNPFTVIVVAWILLIAITYAFLADKTRRKIENVKRRIRE